VKQLCRPAPRLWRFLAIARAAGLEGSSDSGYTRGMKTAVSIPDDVFEKAERLARRMKKSRSELFSRALTEYVARHAPDHVTEAMNKVCAEIGIEPEPFGSAAARRTLERVEW
jgi:Ribbon-helix-helix protein, copG family